MSVMTFSDVRIAVVGLGYVGLPLAAEFAKKRDVLGFDISSSRVAQLRQGVDATLELSEEELSEAKGLRFSSDIADLAECNFYIVTVPTPIDSAKVPDLTPLKKASESLAGVLSAGDVVVYESTVYPGATEEVCVPILERGSGLVLNRDFFAGYSPERINPGDKAHRVNTITKVTSGSTPEAASLIDEVYRSIVTAGTHLASSIKVAEAAKVIENTQRDLNIALVNELAKIFSRLGIDTQEVLAAAATKWNFLPFKPGLVGGHCIGVDPYYLTHKAQAVGYHPEVILAGRRINDGMARFVVSELVKTMLSKGANVKSGRVLVLGLSFKENCPDLRNTKVVDVISELESFGLSVDVCDPWVDAGEAEQLYGVNMLPEPAASAYDAVMLAVAHEQFLAWGADKIRGLLREESVIYDLKSVWPAELVDRRL